MWHSFEFATEHLFSSTLLGFIVLKQDAHTSQHNKGTIRSWGPSLEQSENTSNPNSDKWPSAGILTSARAWQVSVNLEQQLKFPDHPATRRFCLVSSVWIRWAIRVSGACAKLLKESSPRTLDWSPAVSRQDGEPGVCWWKLGAGVLWSILMAFRSLGIKVERKMSPDRCLDTNSSLDERSHCVPTPYYGTSALYEVGWFNRIQENLKNQTC